MDLYRVSLALAYFQTVKERYSLQELKELLGFTDWQMERLLLELQNMKYIAYQNGLLTVTLQGRSYLVSNDQMEIRILDSDRVMPHIYKGHAIPADAPYVPKGFYKKTDR